MIIWKNISVLDSTEACQIKSAVYALQYSKLTKLFRLRETVFWQFLSEGTNIIGVVSASKTEMPPQSINNRHVTLNRTNGDNWCSKSSFERDLWWTPTATTRLTRLTCTTISLRNKNILESTRKLMSRPWENLALQHYILVRILVTFWGHPVCLKKTIISK